MIKHILIVDDEQAVLNAIRRDLSDLENKFKVFFTSNGNEVLEMIEKFTIDILITDIFMPHKEGIELIREVRHKHPLIKIITMSGGGILKSNSYLKVAEKVGANISLSKPFSKEELISAIELSISK